MLTAISRIQYKTICHSHGQLSYTDRHNDGTANIFHVRSLLLCLYSVPQPLKGVLPNAAVEPNFTDCSVEHCICTLPFSITSNRQSRYQSSSDSLSEVAPRLLTFFTHELPSEVDLIDDSTGKHWRSGNMPCLQHLNVSFYTLLHCIQLHSNSSSIVNNLRRYTANKLLGTLNC